MNTDAPITKTVSGDHDWAGQEDPRMARWPSLRDSMRPGWRMCIVCGVIRRHDAANKPCRGVTRIVLREEADDDGV